MVVKFNAGEAGLEKILDIVLTDVKTEDTVSIEIYGSVTSVLYSRGLSPSSLSPSHDVIRTNVAHPRRMPISRMRLHGFGSVPRVVIRSKKHVRQFAKHLESPSRRCRPWEARYPDYQDATITEGRMKTAGRLYRDYVSST